MHDPGPFDHLLAILLGLALPSFTLLAAARRKGAELELRAADRIATYWANGLVLLLVGGAVVLVWRLADRPLAALGLTPPAAACSPGGLALGGVALALFSLDTAWKLRSAEARAAASARWARDTPFMPRTPREALHALAMCLGAAVGEELAFRAHLVSYLLCFTGGGTGTAVAIALPAAVFALAHRYQGAGAVARIAALAVLLGTTFVVTGSLWIPILIHFAIDATGSALSPWMLSAERDAARLEPE